MGLPTEPGKLRKLSWFNEFEGKVRVIAILDYFSQACLKPLHSLLFRYLKKIPQDKTFDQGGFLVTLSRASVFYSVDLTQATDRFPISLIKKVLGGLLPKHYCDS